MYMMSAKYTVYFVPDGASGQTLPQAQSFEASIDTFGNASQSLQLVAGGNAPSSANVGAACDALNTSLKTYLQTSPILGQIQGWASGGN